VDTFQLTNFGTRSRVSLSIYGLQPRERREGAEMSKPVNQTEWQTCIHCHAEYGHKITCPTWTGRLAEMEKQVEETITAVSEEILNLSAADVIRLHGMGVTLL
jgi:hypothetical protein